MEAIRTKMPAAFSRTFSGAEGAYLVRYMPKGEWDGVIEVTISGVAMLWAVDVATTEGGAVTVGGLTRGSEPLWNDVYWYELRRDAQPSVIRYWGDRVLVREDQVQA